MIAFLHHLFIPHHTNNHRARILHNASLLILSLIVLTSSFLFISIKRNNPEILGISYSITENELLVLTNKVRQENNLPPLSLNGQLTSAASEKAKNMFEKNYWAHFAPDGTSPWNFIKNSGYNYIYAGENLAKGFTGTPEVIQAWMNSKSHRENVLSNKYKEIGFAIVEGKLEGEDTVLIVEMFGSTQVPIAENENTPEQNPNPVAIVPNPAAQIPLQQTAAGEHTKKLVVVPQEAVIQSVQNPAVDIRMTTKSISLLLFSGIFFILFIDLLIVERKKIPRIVGHNIDHIVLIGVFILFIIFENAGGII